MDPLLTVAFRLPRKAWNKIDQHTGWWMDKGVRSRPPLSSDPHALFRVGVRNTHFFEATKCKTLPSTLHFSGLCPWIQSNIMILFLKFSALTSRLYRVGNQTELTEHRELELYF